jgi:pyruvate dehydrogenase E2 component (dihydrolipoamide acetyltransferase)
VLVEIRVREGEEASTGATVGILQVDGEPTPAILPDAGQLRQEAIETRQIVQEDTCPPVPPASVDFFGPVPRRVDYGRSSSAGAAKITPLARRLAAQFGVDVGTLTGSGPRGRIVAADVPQHGQAAVSPVAPATDLTAYAGVPHRDVPLDRMRTIIASRLTAAKREVPHFYIGCDVVIDRLQRVRLELQDAHGTRLTINDFLIVAMARAIHRVPSANAVWADGRLLQFDRVDLGVAVAMPGGLITPVIRSADTKSLIAIAGEARDLATRARDRRLSPDEYQGGVATLSNLGMYGVTRAQAIINAPQALIAAVGAAERVATEAADGAVVFVTRIALNLSVDHRVLDGATAAEVLKIMKNSIESPLSLLS